MSLRMAEVSVGEGAAGQLAAAITQLLQGTTNGQLPHTLLLALPPWTALHALQLESVLCNCSYCHNAVASFLGKLSPFLCRA